MKKVVFLTPSLGMGGMERVLVNYANLFVLRGYDVTVLNFTYDDEAIVSRFLPEVKYFKNYAPVKNLLRSGVKGALRGQSRLLPWKTWIKFHSSQYLYKKYIRDDYDVEIAFFGSESFKIISGSEKVNSLGWIHNVNVDAYIKPLGSMKKALKVYEDVGKIICVSAKAKEEIEKVFGRSRDVYVVNNPNDTKAIRERSAEMTVDTKGVFTFVTVARFYDKQKGFIRQLEVCKRLIDDGYSFNLWLVGDGADLDMVKEKAAELGLDNVTFFGQKANPYPYIRSADMYLSASYYEGFSMVMMEAVILGVPMLSTDISGAREMLGDSEYGLVVENTAEGLYNGMAKVLSDRAYYEHLKKKAAERKDYLSEDKIMDRLEEILEGSS